MQTECPHCHTIFRLHEADLEPANGQVRCGHCLAIFVADILDNTNDYDVSTETNEHDTVADIKVTEQSPDDAFSINDEQAIADVIPPELRAETRNKKSKFGFIGNTLLTIAILISIAAGFAQYAYYSRATLIKITVLSPLFENVCSLANCSLPEVKDTKLFLLSSKNIFTHPNVDNGLMISATIINQATFTQAFPIIELRFANVRGETIAARRFTASEYLNIPENQVSKIQPDTPVSFTLEIKDPGDELISYEFDFL